MPLRIQRRTWKNADGSTGSSWRLVIEEWGRDGKRAGSTYPERRDYLKWGIDPTATYDQAKSAAKVINERNRAQKIIEKKSRISKRVRSELLNESAYLPKKIYDDFIQFVSGRRVWGDEIPKKTESHLLAMRKLIREIKTDPSDWPDRAGVIYQWFIRNGYSLSYFQKVLPLLNDYGYVYCKAFQKPFLPIKTPPAHIIERINDANHDARDGATKESKPLTLELLSKLESLPAEQFRWIERSFFFGLRPEEVDSLAPEKRGKTWDMIERSGVQVLRVYQSKLVRLPRARRWKMIPAVLKDQKRVLKEIVKGLEATRPYPKTIRAKIGDGFGVYAGRKGFEAMMIEAGRTRLSVYRWLGKRDLRDLDSGERADGNVSLGLAKSISKQLGHSSLTRTDRSYRKADAVDLGEED